MNGISNPDFLHAGLKTMAMLFIVLALLVSVLYLLKRFLFQRKGVRGDISINVISSLHFSPKERIEVVEILGERILLGITPGNINFLTKLIRVDDEDREKHSSKEEANTP